MKNLGYLLSYCCLAGTTYNVTYGLVCSSWKLHLLLAIVLILTSTKLFLWADRK